MKNMMKEYLGNAYSDDHLRNFCMYWMKGMDNRDEYETEDEWRKDNDLDCMYFDGDLCADTLMSAWTPIKWVADFLNRDVDIKFYKQSRSSEDPAHDLKLLADDWELYLNPDHRLMQLLSRFLELAELRCNFILLPSREMNPARYRSVIRGKTVWLCDEVPATLAHLYDKDSLGRFFLGTDGEVDEKKVSDWIYREHLAPGFELGAVNRETILPLLVGQDPYEPVWPTEEDEIAEALEYMIDLLEIRRELLDEHDGEHCADHNECASAAYAAFARGTDRIPRAIEDAFHGVMKNESPEDVTRIEFNIRSDLPSEVCSVIDRSIRRLCRWYGTDRMIPYVYSYEPDMTQTDICRADAILYLKKERGLLMNRRGRSRAFSKKEENALTRPEGITSNVLWELYKRFTCQEGIRLWVKPDKDTRGKYRLFTVGEASLGHGETNYGVGSMGIELPWSRKEWIDLTLIQCDTGSIYRARITIDALYEDSDPVDELLMRNNMKLAQADICFVR